jgi:hypothetical protein
MPYATPTPAEFKARYPEFAAVPDASVTAVIAEAEGEVGVTWIETDRRPAIMALSAHWLTVQGFAHAQSGAGGVAVPVSGPLRSSRVGDVEESYGMPARASSGDGKSASALSDLDATSYGQRYLSLRRRSFPGVMVL